MDWEIVLEITGVAIIVVVIIIPFVKDSRKSGI